MNSFESKVFNFIKENRMLEGKDKVLIGFSGGADSCALVQVLYELRKALGIQLYALHVNHGIRKEAKEDAIFTESFCRDRDISFYLKEIDVPELAKSYKLTEEEAGRKARYDAFMDIANHLGIKAIAVAHHQNDGAETMLLNLFRGTGLRGSGGVRPVRDNIIRPLLCASRSEIEDYLKEKDIGYCTDYTNFENIHTRNKIRNELLPYVTQNINEGAINHLVRAAREFAMADDYIRQQAEKSFDRICRVSKEEISIRLTQLQKEPEIIRRYVILKCFEMLTPHRKDITASHVDMVLGLGESFDGTARLDLPYNLTALRSYDVMFFKRKEEQVNNIDEIRIELFKDQELVLPGFGKCRISYFDYEKDMTIPSGRYTKWFDCDRIQEVLFRHRNPDDYILIEQGEDVHKKRLSKFMTDEKIPAYERDEIYILADGDNCIWIPGHRISCGYKITANTKHILEIKISIIDGGKEIG